MEKYLNQGVKKVIEEIPAVGDILEDFGIGCAPCAVGTCLLKDVVSIHNLSPDQEAELMDRLEREIYSRGKGKKKPASQARTEIEEIIYSPPVQQLVDEHTVIMSLVSHIPLAVENMRRKGLDRNFVRQGLDFIRSYADRFHHAKEEDILFEYVDKSSEIIQVMYKEHTIARGHVKAAADALEAGDLETINEHLLAYQALLTQHIKKEDQTLYPWIDRQLSAEQITGIEEAFSRVNREMGESARKYEAMAARIARSLSQSQTAS